MNDTRSDKELLEGVRDALDRHAASLDEETLLRLRGVRFEALERQERRRAFFAFPRLVTAGGVATAVVVAVAISVWSTATRPKFPVSHPEELEVVAIRDHLDLYQDLEFYRWLSADEMKGQGR